MSVTLPPQLEAIIREKVESGLYSDPETVVREALRLLDEQDRRLIRLRESLIEAEQEFERGEGEEWTPALMERLNREGDEMYRQGVTPDPDVCA
jgi:antitoxin ParD1/3/4